MTKNQPGIVILCYSFMVYFYTTCGEREKKSKSERESESEREREREDALRRLDLTYH